MSLERRNVIFHIDVNSAFLSWEAVYRLHHLELGSCLPPPPFRREGGSAGKGVCGWR